jgi:hypothetical protein
MCRYNLVFLLLSGVMVGLIWVQLFWSLYFLRLLDLYDVYHRHPMVKMSILMEHVAKR